jgi:hypothetical protein
MGRSSCSSVRSVAPASFIKRNHLIRAQPNLSDKKLVVGYRASACFICYSLRAHPLSSDGGSAACRAYYGYTRGLRASRLRRPLLSDQGSKVITRASSGSCTGQYFRSHAGRSSSADRPRRENRWEQVVPTTAGLLGSRAL